MKREPLPILPRTMPVTVSGQQAAGESPGGESILCAVRGNVIREVWNSLPEEINLLVYA